MRTLLAIACLVAACHDPQPDQPDAPPAVMPDAPVAPRFSLTDPACHALPDRIACSEVVYDVVGGTSLHLDLFAPLAAQTQRVPAVMFVHGGGWLSGDYHDPGLDLDGMLAAGYVVLSVEYRLTLDAHNQPSGVVFPQNLQDLKTAVRWLRTMAADFVDPDRILAYGFSAGAHLVSLLGTTAGIAAFDGRGDPAVSSAVTAVVGLSTPIDFHMFVPQNPPLDPSCPPQPPPGPGGTPSIGVSLLIGGDFADPANSAKLTELSAMTYLDTKTAPMLVFAGTCDQTVPYMGAQELVAHASALGLTQVEMFLAPGAKHGGTLQTPEAKQKLNTFIAAQLAR